MTLPGDLEKDKGNEAFRKGNFESALKYYDLAISAAGETGSNLAALYSNKAAALIKLEKYDLAIQQCRKGLAAPGLSPELKSKINFRIVHAYEAQGKFEDALLAAMECECSPTILEKRTELSANVSANNPEYTSTLRKNVLQNAESIGLDTAAMSAMFDRLADAEEDIRWNLSPGNGLMPGRGELISQHGRLLEIYRDPIVLRWYSTPPIRFDTLNSATSGHVSAELYCFLKPITIGQLRLHEVNVGKILICRTITQPFMMMGALRTLIEDPAGEAMRLAIYNLRAPNEDVSSLLPIGTYLAVKEPWYQSGDLDCFHALRVDNPVNLLYLEQTHSLLQNVKWQTAAPDYPSSPSISHLGTWESFEKRGNEMFVAGNYELAVAAYSDAIELKRNVAPKEVADLLANRAEAYLRDDKPTDAFWDCQSALHVQAGHLKATLRLAKAQSSLGKLVEAKDVLLKSPHSTRPEFQRDIARLNRLIREQQKGDYDLKCLLKEAAASKTPRLDHASYNGGVRKLRVSKEKDYGLVAQRDFAPGDLLFVGKAFEATYTSECRDADNCLTVDPPIAASNETVRHECISRIVRRISKNKDLVKELYQLFAGPDFERFDEDADTEDALVVDCKRVAAIVDLNAFGCGASDTHASGPGHPEVDSAGAGFAFDGCGVWILASFLNHSCVPNTAIFYIGDLMFVRAAKRIRKGEELTTSYTAYGQGYAKRQAVLAKYGFKCECSLCVCDLERAAKEPSLDGERQSFMDSLRGKLTKQSVIERTEVVQKLAVEFLNRLAYKNRCDPHLERLCSAVGVGYNAHKRWDQAATFYKLSYHAVVGKGIKSHGAFVSSAPPVLVFFHLVDVTNNILDFGKAKEYLDKLRQAAKICWGSDDKELLLMLYPALVSSNWFEWLKLNML